MNTITIPKKLIQNDDLVIIPRRRFEEFLDFEKKIKSRLAEKKDTDNAIKIYQKEKRFGKLKTITSLTELD